jgi:hypothetical protein
MLYLLTLSARTRYEDLTKGRIPDLCFKNIMINISGYEKSNEQRPWDLNEEVCVKTIQTLTLVFDQPVPATMWDLKPSKWLVSFDKYTRNAVDVYYSA